MKRNCWKALLWMAVILLPLCLCQPAKADKPASQTGVICKECGSGMRADCGAYMTWFYCDNCGYDNWISYGGHLDETSPFHNYYYNSTLNRYECSDCSSWYEPKCGHSNYVVMNVRFEYNKN